MTISQFRLALAWILAGCSGCLGATEVVEAPSTVDLDASPASDAPAADTCLIPSPAAGYVPCPDGYQPPLPSSTPAALNDAGCTGDGVPFLDGCISPCFFDASCGDR